MRCCRGWATSAVAMHIAPNTAAAIHAPRLSPQCRPQKVWSCQAGRLSLPLRSADHPAWLRNRQCTNIPLGPVAGGRSIPMEDLRTTETTITTGRPRRIAEFDWEQFRDSVQMNGPTDIALTFVDYFDVQNRTAYRFEKLTLETIRFVQEVERVSGRPVSLLSTDFGWRNVIDRRTW